MNRNTYEALTSDRRQDLDRWSKFDPLNFKEPVVPLQAYTDTFIYLIMWRPCRGRSKEKIAFTMWSHCRTQLFAQQSNSCIAFECEQSARDGTYYHTTLAGATSWFGLITTCMVSDSESMANWIAEVICWKCGVYQGRDHVAVWPWRTYETRWWMGP